jgi:hypothetical protein
MIGSLYLHKTKRNMKTFVATLAMFAVFGTFAQNLQLHYDFGSADNFGKTLKRNYFTSTVEFFKPDTLGSTFMFADFDFAKGNGGISMAYTELSRKFTLHKKSGLSLQIEYNDGSPAFITPAFLGGFSYPVKIGRFTVHTSLLYKSYQKAKSPDVQVTLVWNELLFKSKLFFSGFVDVWSQDEFSGSGKEIVFLAEPQLWYCVTRHLKLGGELEVSRNFFVFDDAFKFMPTVAARWDF